MCRVLDDILPVLGGIGGFLIGGPAGAAIGGALGGGVGNYAQTHNLLGAGLGALTGGVGGYFGGGSLAGALGNLGSSSVGAATQGFDTALMSNLAPNTLGALESGAGGAAMFGPMAGTGTAIGSAASTLGGAGLGLAGGGALSGVSQTPSFLGALGGGTQGTGLGVGSQASSQADLTGALSGSAPSGAVGETSAATTTSPLSNPLGSPSAPQALSSNQSAPGLTANPTSPIGSNVQEGSQAATTGSGAPYGYDTGGATMEGTQAAQMPGSQQGALAAMYGPNSTATGSTVGQGIAGTNVEVPGAGNVQFGALGEGTPAAPGMATGGAATGAGKAMDLQGMYNQISPFLALAKTGLGAYQQYAQQQKYNDYLNNINQLYAPNSPYAQMMEQTLARQDAAAGRNSQYGNRAVQLAAALTQGRERALTSAPYSQASFANPGANILNSLFSNFSGPQGMQNFTGLYNAGSAGLGALSNLFS